MEFINKVTVITPDSFNEFYSEHGDAVVVRGDGHMSVTEVIEGMIVRTKVYAPGQWTTVESELVAVEVEEVDGFGIF
jgi:hypothetical protein